MISENRFKFISCFIRFGDKATRADCWKTDKFACIRELFETMNERNAKMRYSSPQLAMTKHCTHTMDVLALSSITLANLQSMLYCIEVSVILRQPTHTSLWHMLGNQKELMVLVPSTTSLGLTSTQNTL